MPDRTTLLRSLVLAGVVSSLWAMPAAAHKIKIFASAESNTISGYVYFPGGGRAKEVTVSFTDAEGNSLGEVRTDENGDFSFAPSIVCDHILECDTGDGHRATFTVKASEVAPILGAAAPAGNEPQSPQNSDAEGATVGGDSPPSEAAPIVAGSGGIPIEKVVDRVISDRLSPLREQLEEYEEHIWFRDIIGGMGYIVGFAGLWAFLSARKRNQRG